MMTMEGITELSLPELRVELVKAQAREAAYWASKNRWKAVLLATEANEQAHAIKARIKELEHAV